jgi:hypothetical protein
MDSAGRAFSQGTGATVMRADDEPIYVTDPGPNDILLGRGAPVINYEGNIRFRALVSSRKREYIGSGRHQVKDTVAKSIIDEIEKRGGRFLRRVETISSAAATSNASTTSDDNKPTPTEYAPSEPANKRYRIVEYDVAIEKVKQALRDKETIRHQVETTGTGSGTTNESSGNAATLAEEQKQQNLLDLRYSLGSATAGYDLSYNSTGTIAGIARGNADTVNASNEYNQHRQLQLLSMQIQQRLANDRMALYSQQERIQQEQNQQYLALLNQIRSQSTATSLPNLSSLQQNNLPNMHPALASAASFSLGTNATVNGTNATVNDLLLLRQRADLLMAARSLDANGTGINRNNSSSSRPTSLSQYDMLNRSFHNNEFSRLANLPASLLGQDYLQRDISYAQVLQQPASTTEVNFGELVTGSSSQGVGGSAPIRQSHLSALLPLLGSTHSTGIVLGDEPSDLIRSIRSTDNMTSMLPSRLGNSEHRLVDHLNNDNVKKRKDTKEDGNMSVSKSPSASSSSSQSDCKESVPNGTKLNKKSKPGYE